MDGGAMVPTPSSGMGLSAVTLSSLSASVTFSARVSPTSLPMSSATSTAPLLTPGQMTLHIALQPSTTNLKILSAMDQPGKPIRTREQDKRRSSSITTGRG